MGDQKLCLFCQDKIIPYSFSDGKEEAPKFGEVCQLLGITPEEKPRGRRRGVKEVKDKCDQWLCLCCFELVEQLQKLWREMGQIRRKVKDVIATAATTPPGEKRRSRGRKTGGEVEETFRRWARDYADTPTSAKRKVNPRKRSPVSEEDPFTSEEDESPVKTEQPDDASDDQLEDALDFVRNDLEAPENPVSPLPPPSPTKPTPTRKRKRPLKKDKPPPKKRVAPSTFTCPDCSLTFTQLHKYYAHRGSHRHARSNTKSLNIPTTHSPCGKRVLSRQCTICDFSVKSAQLSKYLEHSLSHEPPASSSCSDTPPHTCTSCPRTFHLPLNLTLHRICHHELSPYFLRCEHCDISPFTTQSQLLSHLRTHISSPTSPLFPCKACPMAYTSLDRLLLHMAKHAPSRHFPCPSCPLVFPTLRELYSHCRASHLLPKQNCPHCPKSFLMPTTLKQHLRLSHGLGGGGGGEHYCGDCNNGKPYKSQLSLRRHRKLMHGDISTRPHKCPHCEKGFIYKSHLVKHVEEKHDRIRHPCPHCPKSYSEAIQLSYHLRVHTGEGLYTCEVCGKQFPRLQQLKIHGVVHLPQRGEGGGWVCEVCGKEFPSQIHLQKHKNSHKEKRLECEHCHQKFRRPDHLRGHLRTHTGERPYGCPTCEKRFNRRDILMVHMKMHGYSMEEASKAYDSWQEQVKTAPPPQK